MFCSVVVYLVCVLLCHCESCITSFSSFSSERVAWSGFEMFVPLFCCVQWVQWRDNKSLFFVILMKSKEIALLFVIKIIHL